MGRREYAPSGYGIARMHQSNRALVALREKTFAFVVAPDADAETIFEAEFFEDVLNVLLHRRGAATEKFADLFVALAVADPSGYFEFARRGRFFSSRNRDLELSFRGPRSARAFLEGMEVDFY